MTNHRPERAAPDGVADPGPIDDGPIDDGLPPEDDASWTETTEELLQYLRNARRRHRQARLRAHAYTGYVTTMIIGIYVLPPVVSAVRGSPPPGGGGTHPAPVLGAVTAALLVLVALVRDGLWRGPVLLDQASAGWLLPLPVRRAPLLRPRLRRALLTAGVAGAGVGGVGGVLLRLVGGGSATSLAASGAAAGVVVLVLGVALGALAESADERARARLHRVGGALWLLPALTAMLALLPAGDGRVAATVALWSGPWGWAVQPLAAAMPGRSGTAPWTAWPIALAAAALVCAVAVTVAERRVTAVTNRVLRARAATVTAVAQSLGTLQPRRARLLVEAAQGRGPRTRWRLPVPRWRALLVPWRDATAVLRSPSRLVWGLIWCAVAAPLAAASAGRTGLPRFGLGLAALIAGYLAVAQLAEGTRLDADDPRTVLGLPISATRLAIDHLITPLVVLAVALAVSVPVLTVAAPPGWRPAAALTLLGAGLPALAGAAIVSAFRGDIPVGILTGGTAAASPMGSPGPILVVLWYVRGPIAAIALLTPTALGRPSVSGAVVAAAVMIGWATLRVRRVLG